MRTPFTLIVALATAVTLSLPAGAEISVETPTFPRNDYAVWSPDGKLIAFTSDRLGSLDIFVMKADGTQQRAVVRSPGDEWRPAWSPDGKRLAFVSDRHGLYAQIYTVDLATGLQVRLTFSETSDYTPSWSSDGRIAFRRLTFDEESDEETSSVYVMNADGTGLRQLIADGEYHLSPAWSPDGSRIAFVGGGEDDAYIDVVNADGSGHVRLTTDGFEYEPSWSPDGTRIVFVSWEDDTRDVWIMNADGSGRRKLFGTRSDSEYAARIAPDGKRLVFTSDATGEAQIYMASARGTAQKRLTGVARVMSSTGRRCTVIGTAAADVLQGTTHDDVICGLGGDDVLRGGGGEDLLDGGPGNDVIAGGSQEDTMLGGAGNDSFEAIDGFRDSVDGGPGRDRAHLDPNDWLSSVEILG